MNGKCFSIFFTAFFALRAHAATVDEVLANLTLYHQYCAQVERVSERKRHKQIPLKSADKSDLSEARRTNFPDVMVNMDSVDVHLIPVFSFQPIAT